MLILMKYPTESVTSSNVKGGVLIRSRYRHGHWLERAGVRHALMRPVPVVELLELPQGVQEGDRLQISVRSRSSRRQVCTHRSIGRMCNPGRGWVGGGAQDPDPLDDIYDFTASWRNHRRQPAVNTWLSASPKDWRASLFAQAKRHEVAQAAASSNGVFIAVADRCGPGRAPRAAACWGGSASRSADPATGSWSAPAVCWAPRDAIRTRDPTPARSWSCSHPTRTAGPAFPPSSSARSSPRDAEAVAVWLEEGTMDPGCLAPNLRYTAARAAQSRAVRRPGQRGPRAHPPSAPVPAGARPLRTGLRSGLAAGAGPRRRAGRHGVRDPRRKWLRSPACLLPGDPVRRACCGCSRVGWSAAGRCGVPSRPGRRRSSRCTCWPAGRRRFPGRPAGSAGPISGCRPSRCSRQRPS
jgi:hypothetical protein